MAANQVDLPYRLFVMNVKGDPAEEGEAKVFINPVITRKTGSAEAQEGCLSFPEIWAPVRRPEKIVVSAYGIDGQEFTYEMDGLYARAVQHEIDHLDGVVFIDRLSQANQLAVREDLEELVREFESSRRLVGNHRKRMSRSRPVSQNWNRREPRHTFMRLVMMGTGPFAVPTFRGLFRNAPHGGCAGDRTDQAAGQTPDHRQSDARRGSRARCRRSSTRRVSTARKRWPLSASMRRICILLRLWPDPVDRVPGNGPPRRDQPARVAASQVSRCRPINWAIYDGEEETGVSVIHMTPKIDAGPVIAQGRTPIEPEETADSLEDRLAEIGSWLIRRSIDSLESGNLEALPQDPALASKAPRLKKTDGEIDWSRPAEAIRNQIRAFHPWPKTYTFWRRSQGKPLRLIVGPIEVLDDSPHRQLPERCWKQLKIGS